MENKKNCDLLEEEFLQDSDEPKKPIKKPYMPDLTKIPKHDDRKTHITEDIFSDKIVHTADTIGNYVLPKASTPEEIEKYEQEMLVNIYSIIHMMESMKMSDPFYQIVVKTTFIQLKYLCRLVPFMRGNSLFLLLVKSLFHRYIAVLGHKELIEIYDDVFSDRIYSGDNEKYVFVPTISEEWCNEKIKEYQTAMKQMQIRKMAKRKPPKYEKGEIVGAQDRERKWWLSQILEVFEFNGNQVYYVRFAGWGDKFDEFIPDGFRLQKYNSKKHKYYRPAWANKNVYIKPIDCDAQTEVDEETDETVQTEVNDETVQTEVNDETVQTEVNDETNKSAVDTSVKIESAV